MQEIDIARMALRKNHVFDELASTDGTITNLSSTGSVAMVIKEFYEQARRKVLRQAPWTCVMKRAVLDLTNPHDHDLGGFLYEFDLPSDYLNQVEVVSEDGIPIRYRIERGKLFADETPTLVYIPDEKDPNLWDPLLTEAVIFQLASDIAYPITGSHENEVALAQSGMMIIQQALTQTRAEHYQGPQPSKGWMPDLFPEVRR